MKRRGVLVALAAAAVCASAGSALAAPRVAVVIGESLGVEPGDADQLGAALAAALSKQLVVDAIGGSDVTRRLPPAGLPDECLATPACLADLGARLDADRLLVLVLVRGGNEIQVDANDVVVATGAATPRPRVAIIDLTAAQATFAAEATRYVPDAPARDQGTTIVVGGGDEESRPIRPIVWGIGGAGVAALVGAGVLGLSVRSAYAGCDDPALPCARSKVDDIHRRAIIADVVLGVGVAAVATAVVLYVQTPTEKTRVQPAMAPVSGGAVVGFAGRF